MRVTTNMMFNNMINNMGKKMSMFRNKQSIIDEERKIFTPSDDAIGTNNATQFRSSLATYGKYVKNMEEAESKLKLTNSVLDSLNSILVSAKEYGELGATEASTPEQRKINAEQINSLINRTIDLANTKYQGEYIFSGYKSDTQAFSKTGNVLEPYAYKDNFYDGSLKVTGDYNGEENKDYLVRITSDGVLGTARYRISEDGGENWSDEQTISSTIMLHDNVNSEDSGLTLNLSAGDFREDDQFMVKVVSGKYLGDNGKLETHAGKYSNLKTNVTGQEAIVDTKIIETLYKMKIAMENDNTQEISDSLAQLELSQNDFQKQLAKVGTYLNHAELAKNSLTDFQTSTLQNLKDTEQPDMVKALMEMTLAENSLNTSINIMAKIIPQSLLNYL